MRIMPAEDFNAAPVISAGGNSAIANDETRNGNAVFRIRFRIGDIHRFVPIAPDHQVTANIHDSGLRALKP